MSGGFPQFTYDPRIGVIGRLKRMTPRRGRILFQMTPGTAPASASGMYVGVFQKDSNNYIKVYFSAANTITLAFKDAVASEGTDTWDCTSSLVSGTVYEVKIEYDKTYMKMFVDNTEVASISQDVNFTGNTKPDKYWLGTDASAANGYTSTTFTSPDRLAYIREDA